MWHRKLNYVYDHNFEESSSADSAQLRQATGTIAYFFRRRMQVTVKLKQILKHLKQKNILKQKCFPSMKFTWWGLAVAGESISCLMFMPAFAAFMLSSGCPFMCLRGLCPAAVFLQNPAPELTGENMDLLSGSLAQLRRFSAASHQGPDDVVYAAPSVAARSWKAHYSSWALQITSRVITSAQRTNWTLTHASWTLAVSIVLVGVVHLALSRLHRQLLEEGTALFCVPCFLLLVLCHWVFIGTVVSYIDIASQCCKT